MLIGTKARSGNGSNWLPPGSASNSSDVSAVSRIPNSMEVWWVGDNGSIQDAYWYEGAQWQRFELAPAGSASTSGGVSAVSRITNSMEVWWVGANGSIQDAYWYEGAHWQQFELAPPGSASDSGDVSSVSRIPDSMEVWWIGVNGSIQDAYWYADSVNPPNSINPAITVRFINNQGNFLEVTGGGFTPNRSVKLSYLIKDQGSVTTTTSGTESLMCDGSGKFLFQTRVTSVNASFAQAKAIDEASGAQATGSTE